MHTKHNLTACTMSFGRPSKLLGACSRCDELRAGAVPRRGWTKYGAKVWEAHRVRAIAAHDCAKSKCGPVCTAFDW